MLPPRYEGVTPLGPAPAGERFAAHDRVRGRAVEVVRAAPRPTEDPRAAGVSLERAYWALAACRHPVLPEVLDYGLAPDGTPYYTLVPPPGPAMSTLALPRPEAEVQAWLPQVVAGLAALHSAGLVHGNLSPATLHRGPDGRMGLALAAPVPVGVAGAARGDAAYASPEATRRDPLDGRADWYALAAVIYHMLAGKPPEGASPRLRQAVPAASRAFDEALLRLLAKDPAARPAHAAGVLAAFGLAGEVDDHGALLASPVLGREAELGMITWLLDAPAGAGLWIVGPPGVGKSRLLDEARGRARSRGLEAFAARGLGFEASPYEAVLPWLRALVARAPASAAEAVAAVAAVLPERAVAPTLDAAQARARLHAAAVELARLVAPGALWVLDDADRLDPASTMLLAALRRGGPEQRWRWAFAAAEAPKASAEAPDERLAVDVLPRRPLLNVAQAHLGQEDLPGLLMENLPVLTEGLPGRIAPLLRHWIATGDMVREAGRWVASPGATFAAPPDLAVAPDEAVKALGGYKRAVARSAALLGDRMPQSWLQAAVAMAPAEFFASVAGLEQAAMLARDGAYIRFKRPGHAAAIVATLPADQREKLRGEAARRIAAAGAPAPDDPALPLADVVAMARLLLASDTPVEGVPWALRGAQRALAIHAPLQAETLASLAIATPGVPRPDKLSLGLVLVDAWRNLGRAHEAFALCDGQLMPALRAAPPADMARHVTTFGVLQQAEGHYAAARALWAEGIALADAAGLPKEAVRARIFAGRLAFFEGSGDQALRHFADAVAVARGAALQADLGWALALYGHMLATRDPAKLDEGLAHLAEARGIQARLGNNLRLFEAINDEGNLLLAAGRPKAARELFEQCLAIAAAVGPQEAIYAHLNMAFTQLELGEPASARAGAELVTELAQRLGSKLPESFAAAVEGLALVRSGSPVLGWARLERGLALAGSLGNRYAELAAGALAVEALVELGRLDAARAGVGRLRELGAATANHEHDARFDHLSVALEVLGKLATAGAAADALVAKATKRGSPAEIAQARRWQAQGLIDRDDLDGAATALVAAEHAAAEAGLGLLQGELAFLQGERVQRRGQPLEAAFAYARALGVGEKLGAVPLQLQAQMALGSVDPAQAGVAEAAKQRFAAILAELAPAEREAYARRLVPARLLAGPT